MAVTPAVTHTTRQDALTLLEEEHRAVEKLSAKPAY